MGVTVQQVVDSQNRILTTYTKQFHEFEAKLAQMMSDKLLRIMPQIETLSKQVGVGMGSETSERLLALEKTVNVLKSYKGWNKDLDIFDG